MSRIAVLPPLVGKEIRALLPLWAGTVAALAGAAAWRGGDLSGIALFVYVIGALAIGAQSVGQEYTHRTLPMLLAQPVDRRRMFVIKFGAAAALLLMLAGVGTALVTMSQTQSVRYPFVIVPVLCGLFLAPLVTMMCRNTLAGALISAQAVGFCWLLALAIAWFGLGIGADAMEQLVLQQWVAGASVACPIAGFLSWRRFIALEATAATATSLRLPRWHKRTLRPRRHSPLRALIAKELHLQQLAFVVAGLYLVTWTLLSLAQRYVPSTSNFPVGGVMLMYCVGLAIVIGALGSAEERQHGTFDVQSMQPVSAVQQWMVKAAVTIGLSLAFAVGLPVAANGLAALEGFHSGPDMVDLVILVVVLTSSSLYASSLCESGVRALALWLPICLAVTMFVQMLNGIIQWATPQLVSATMAFGQPTPLVLVSVRGFALAVVTSLLWLGYRNHTACDRSLRRLAPQAAVMAMVVTAGILLVRLTVTATVGR
jgi:ABC-type transport system involved in multi-copper enzyme maturation permease subunit